VKYDSLIVISWCRKTMMKFHKTIKY